MLFNFTNIVNETAYVTTPTVFTSMSCKDMKLDIDTATQSGCTKVVFDFSRTKKFDSRAHDYLKKVRRDIKPENFFVINVSGQPLHILETTNCDEWIKQP